MFYNKNTTRVIDKIIHVVLAAAFILVGIVFSGCERIQPIIPPAASETTIKIGLIYSPTDPGTTRNGVELAVSIANEAGGIKGKTIELLTRESNREPLLSVQHAKELINAGVFAILGPDYSDEAVEVGAVVQQYGIPMMTTYPTNPKVTRNGNFSFLGAIRDPDQARIMANFAVEELNAKTAAVLTETGDSYSEELSIAFINDFAAQGGMVATQQFYDSGVTDFTEQLTEINAVDPPIEIVFLAGLGSEFPLAVKQAKSEQFGVTATFLGGDGWDRPDLIEIDGTALEGSFFANHFSTNAPLSETGNLFVNLYIENFGMTPNGPAALGFDSTNIVIQAMQRSSILTPAAIRDQIEVTQNYDGAMMLSHFDENRYAIKGIIINTVKDGKIQFHRSIAP
ncbi:ABC transporter substrate-binding protein [Candidatus Poribacteria bacterium]|nr:ABC transporter substrate-binding protein [Candidatus Poribacteria bacterium]MYI94811.1 ABC transporter substrate-binding protein [Candidatus Poribacteria bacterium]